MIERLRKSLGVGEEKVESDGLECRSKNHRDPHFSRESNIELGRRYAEAMIKALSIDPFQCKGNK